MSPAFLKKIPVPELCALIITLLVLAGFESRNGYPLMSTATAVLMLVTIAAKLFYEYSEFRPGFLKTSRLLAAIIAVAGVIRIAGFFFKLGFINNIFYGEYRGVDHSMVLIAAFSFIALGIAIYRITYNEEKIMLPHILALTTLFVAMLSMIAYFFGGNSFYGIGIYRPTGLAASINFFLLSMSILMVNRKKGFMGDITGEYQGSKIARVLLPIAVAVPIVLGFFQLETERTQLHAYPYNVALITLARILILVLFIWRIAVLINRSNKGMLEEVEQRKLNEGVLRYRTALLEAQKEAIPDAMLVVDSGMKILSFNRQFLDMWKIPDDIIKSNNDEAALNFAITQVSDPVRFMERVNYIYSHPDEPAHDEILFKDGRIIERLGNQVVDENGKYYGRAWYFRDITQNRKYEEQIKNFNRELEEKIARRTEQLDKSEKRFRLLVENSLDIISLIDFDGRIMYISPSIKRLTGYSEQAIVGKSGFDIIHPSEVESAKRFREELLKMPGVPAKSTFRIKTKDNGYIWVEGTVTNLLNDENVRAFVLNYHDITKRKKAEEEILKSEKRFRTLVENSEEIISLSDKNGMRFYITPAMERITGFTYDETLNHPVFDHVHPDDIEVTKKLREEFLKEPGVLKPLVFRFVTKDGRIVYMEGTVRNLLEDDNVKAVVGNYRDVTEKRLNEEKLRETNERFEIVSKATNDAVWDWDLETDAITWNDEIRLMFNCDPHEILHGSDWKVHVHPEDFRRVIRRMVFHVKKGLQNWQDEYRFRCGDGSYKYVFNRGFILYGRDKKPYRIIGAMQDVTEINKLQQSLSEERIIKQRELTNATIQGQEKERAEIGRELHDNVNQLLTGTKLYLDVAASQPALKDEMIRRSAENLTLCMEEIRRLTSALVPPSVDITNLEYIIEDLVEPIKLATNIKVQHDAKDIGNENLSREQQVSIYRIIQEHLNNIVKHSKASNVLISVRSSGNNIVITIKDDGQGFNVTTRRKGIGFKNIQSRAELLNGKMEIVSQPGKGCLLQVTFPVTVDVME